MSSGEFSNWKELVPKKTSPVNLDIFPVQPKDDENELNESQRLLDAQCKHECLYGAADSIVKTAQCKITEMYSLHESIAETDWLHVDKPNQPGKPLTKVRICVACMLYIENVSFCMRRHCLCV